MHAVILAAGKGTRLYPLTLNRTKAMMPIVGKPIIERVMEPLIEQGIREFVLVISPDDAEIKPYFSQERQLEVDIHFVTQVERLGMAHALSLVAPHLRGDFILSAGDSFTSANHVKALLAAHREKAASATLSLMEVPPAGISRTGIVALEDGYIKRIVEKPRLENAPSNIASLPLYVFTTCILDYLPDLEPSPRGEYELQDAIQRLIEHEKNVRGVFTPSRLQLTNAADLLTLNRHYLSQDDFVSHLGPRSVGAQTQLIAPFYIEEAVRIGPGCVIGPNVYLEGDCEIGAGAVLKDAVVVRGGKVEAGQRVIGSLI